MSASSSSITKKTSMSSTLPPLYRRTSSGIIQLKKTNIHEKRNSLEDSEERTKIQYDISMFTLWDSIRKLVECGSKITIENKETWFKNTLHWAAESGKISIINWLLKNGVNINIKDNKNGEIALHKATKIRHPSIVKTLILNGSDINCQDKYGETPLHYAAMYGQLENLLHLISYGANINIININRETIAHKIMLKGGDTDTNITMLDCLIQSGINLNALDIRYENVLHISARTRKFKEFDYLRQRNVKFYSKNIFGETPSNIKDLVANNWKIRDTLNRQVQQVRRDSKLPVFNLN